MSQSSSKQTSSHGFTVARQTALYQQHLDKEFCDIIIKLKDETFYVHSCIVAAACPKLQKIIDYQKKPTDPNSISGPAFEVDLDDSIFTPKVFEFILSYIYLGVLDWAKVAPGLVNQILDAANWCGFNQLIEDYMSTTHEEDVEESAGSTIVMVDTCDTIEEIVMDEDEYTADDKEPSYAYIQDTAIEGLFCIVCNEKFEPGEDEALAEHMKMHEEPFQDEVSRRGLSKRKASLGVRNTYKSLIPSSSISTTKNEKSSMKRSSSKKGKIAMFKQDFICKQCGMKCPSRRALRTHEVRDCAEREQPHVQLEPLSTEEIANHLISELISANSNNSGTLPSTKGVTVQTGTIVRPYKAVANDDETTTILSKKFRTAKLWICPRCPDVIFDRKRDQLNHIRSVHGVIKRHVCEHCGKSLDGKTALALHMRIHTGERPFVCPTCGRGFSERKTMEDHTRRHTGERPFLCTVCGKDFGYRQSLYRHMKFHVGERPYQCQICNKTFVLKQNLQEHVARHNKHQLVNCGQCNLRFSNKELLLKHQLEIHVVKSKIYSDETAPSQNINVLDMTDEGGAQVASYEVTIDNSVLDSLTEQ